MSIKAGAGDDLVLVDTGLFYVDNLTINMGTGSDRVDLGGVYGYTNENVETLLLVFGAGADSLSIDDVEVDRTSIKMNGNNNDVRITDSGFYDSFDLKGGAKADVVEIGNNYFGGVNTLNGGGGNNVLADLGRNLFSDATTSVTPRRSRASRSSRSDDFQVTLVLAGVRRFTANGTQSHQSLQQPNGVKKFASWPRFVFRSWKPIPRRWTCLSSP